MRKCQFCALAKIELGDGATVMFWASAYLLGMHPMDIAPNLTPYQRKGHPVRDAFADGENITDVWEHIMENVIPGLVEVLLHYQDIWSSLNLSISSACWLRAISVK
jgi:hypothetical protein